VVNIHKSLGNADWLRHYRREILRKLDLVPEKLGAGMGDKFIHEMFAWEQFSFSFFQVHNLSIPVF
jgi:hypothetical protein